MSRHSYPENGLLDQPATAGRRGKHQVQKSALKSHKQMRVRLTPQPTRGECVLLGTTIGALMALSITAFYLLAVLMTRS